MSAPRVRFAPSPTGYFHVGSARSSLFNFLIARQDPEGVFILRIEDTDAERNREEWVTGITEAMHWLGFDPDVGPYRQSDYTAEHQAAVAALLESGHAYYCDCTGEMVQARKGENKTPGYDGFCRNRQLAQAPNTAVRFRTPDEGTVVVPDLIRGDVAFSHEVIDDFVVAKSSGQVLYALANVVDDRRDGITHVIRGEEHLPNAPKQMLLWSTLSAVTGVAVDLPVYAHLPLLVDAQRKKLSKRKDPVATEMYRDQGYLAEAFVNYLALLGWSPGQDQEIVPLDTCIREFRLQDVSHSPAFFDVKKLTHINGEYIRALTLNEFIERSRPWVTPWDAPWRPSDSATPWTKDQFDEQKYLAIAPLVQERVATMSEIVPMIAFLFLANPVMDEVAFAKTIASDEGRRVLDAVIEQFATADWTAPVLHETLVAAGEGLGLNLRKSQAPVRLAITGATVGPPLFESLELLGRDEALRRLNLARSRA